MELASWVMFPGVKSMHLVIQLCKIGFEKTVQFFFFLTFTNDGKGQPYTKIV